jgi:hypothetical protein
MNITQNIDLLHHHDWLVVPPAWVDFSWELVREKREWISVITYASFLISTPLIE